MSWRKVAEISLPRPGFKWLQKRLGENQEPELSTVPGVAAALPAETSVRAAPVSA
jgi:hypothetical protein